jgi:hypothetical protein
VSSAVARFGDAAAPVCPGADLDGPVPVVELEEPASAPSSVPAAYVLPEFAGSRYAAQFPGSASRSWKRHGGS